MWLCKWGTIYRIQNKTLLAITIRFGYYEQFCKVQNWSFVIRLKRANLDGPVRYNRLRYNYYRVLLDFKQS